MKILNWAFVAISHYGKEHQKKKAIEEMGELITALSREQDGRATEHDVITEIADVSIMMCQLMEIYGNEKCQKEIQRKQARLMRRMDREHKEIYDRNGTKD